MPRSRWPARKEKAPLIVTAKSAAPAAAVPTADSQAHRAARPRGAPISSSTGHTLSSAPIPASTPATAGRRRSSSSAGTATAVTITS